MRLPGKAGRAMIRLEGSFWMMRLNWSWAPLMIAPGWLAAADPPGTLGLVAIMATGALSMAGANVINDVVDAEKDRVTAPELPIPSGAVGIWQGIATAALIAAAMMVTSAIASDSLLAYAGCIVVLGAGGVLTVLYSLAKRYWLLAPAIAACVSACLPLAAWLAAGGGSAMPIAAVLGYQFLYGAAVNIQAAVRDVEADGEVGNNSIAARLGTRRAFSLGVALDCLAHAMILAVGFSIGRPAIAVVAVTASLCLVGTAYASVLAQVETVQGRVGHLVSGRRLVLSRQAEPLALVAVFSIPVAACTLIVTALLLSFLIPGYTRRVISGRLAMAAKAPPPGETMSAGSLPGGGPVEGRAL